MPAKKKKVPMARVNTRVRPDQQKFIKVKAKKEKKTEGEIFREVIDYYITDTKK